MNKIDELRKQYYQSISLLQDEEDILAALPNLEYENFFLLIEGIIQSIEEEIADVKSIKSDDELSRMYIEEEIALLLKKKEICSALLEKGLEVKELESEAALVPKKHLVFATTDGGNVCLENDLKSIPEEYFQTVADLLDRLRFGSSENNGEKAKKLSTVDKKMAKIHELKDFKVRLFYKNLSVDTVYILMVRMKRANNDSVDRTEIIERANRTSFRYERVKNLIKNEKFKNELIDANEIVLDRIMSYLNQYKRG